MRLILSLILLVPLVFGVFHDLSFLGEDISWEAQDEILSIRFRGNVETNTWFAIGIVSHGMYDVWTIYRDEGKCSNGCVVDGHQMDRFHAIDTNSALFGLSIDTVGDTLTTQFSRKFQTGDNNDIEIIPGEEQILFWTSKQSLSSMNDCDIEKYVVMRKRIDFGEIEAYQKRQTVYTYTSKVDDITFEWAVDTERIHGKITAPTTGWVAVGFAKTADMPDTDAMMAFINAQRTTVVRDVYTIAHAAPPLDTTRGGTADFDIRGSSDANGATVIEFRRKLVTGDANDLDITDKFQIMHYAYGATDDITVQHTNKGTWTVNLITGAVPAAGTAAGNTDSIHGGQFLLIVVGVIAAIWVVFRFLHKFIKMIKRSRSKNDPNAALDRKKSIVPRFIQRFLHWRIPKTHLHMEFILVWTFYMILCAIAIIIDPRGRVSKKWGNAFGSVLVANVLLLAIPATKNSLLVLLLGIPFDRTIHFHRWMGRWTIIMATIHAGIEIKRFGVAPIVATVIDRYGIVAWCCFVLMGITSIEPIRRRCYEAFQYLHFFYIIAFIFIFLHQIECRSYMIAVLIIMVFDKLVRFIWGTIPVRAMLAVPKNQEVVQLRFRKRWLARVLGLHRVGQYMFVNFPTINPLEWHPFSVSSGPDEDIVEIHVKASGAFTRKLLNVVSNNSKILIRTDGPYGNLTFNYRRFQKIVLVAGGIGVTPIISILKDIYRFGTLDPKSSQTHRHQISEVTFVWTVQNPESYNWFREEIEFFTHKSGTMGFPKLELKIYVSRGDPEYPFFKGRPDIRNIIGNVASTTDYHQAMMVFACGPELMVNDAWDTCTEWKGKGTHIKFHKETFAF